MTEADSSIPIVELQFMPCIGFFSLIKSFENLRIEAHENYQKRSFRNKAFLLSSQGTQSLTIPLTKGKNQRTPIRSVRISDDIDWIKPALRLVHSCYGQAAFFEYYIDDLTDIFEKGHQYLWQLNLDLLHFFCSKIDIDVPDVSESYVSKSKFDFRHFYLPNKDVDQKTIKFIPYPQVFELEFGFTPNLSILDLLMNMGLESKNHIPHFL